MSADYEPVMADVEEAFKKAIQGFAEWFAASGKMTKAEWVRTYEDPPPKGDYFDGFNAGVESVMLSVDLFLDEVGP